MYLGHKILALIPARGGSKGLPGKNTKQLLGKPLLAWSIEHCKQSKYFDRTIVSTDSQEIARTAMEFGGEAPFLRPAAYASDTASSIDVILHCLDWLAKKEERYDLVALIEPTSPLRDTSDLDLAVKRLLDHPQAESIVGICKVESQHPDFLVRISNEFLHPYFGNSFTPKRRQEIDEAYYFEGSLYISWVESLRKRKSFYHDKTIGYVVPKWKSFEIDDMIDFTIIEHLLEMKLQGKIVS